MGFKLIESRNSVTDEGRWRHQPLPTMVVRAGRQGKGGARMGAAVRGRGL